MEISSRLSVKYMATLESPTFFVKNEHSLLWSCSLKGQKNASDAQGQKKKVPQWTPRGSNLPTAAFATFQKILSV